MGFLHLNYPYHLIDGLYQCGIGTSFKSVIDVSGLIVSANVVGRFTSDIQDRMQTN